MSLPEPTWVTISDGNGRRVDFEVGFLTSRWRCIYGAGCQGILTERAPERAEGCCSFGAHLADDDDLQAVAAAAARLTAEQWQYREEARRREGPFKRNAAGEVMTRIADGACIFLNRPGFPAGAGCALHRGALDASERPMDWKPDVCWMVPVRREFNDDGSESVRAWSREDFGEGGEDFAWWCPEVPEAYVGEGPVYRELADELTELVGPQIYLKLRRRLDRAAQP
jgi:hypothetical protein